MVNILSIESMPIFDHVDDISIETMDEPQPDMAVDVLHSVGEMVDDAAIVYGNAVVAVKVLEDIFSTISCQYRANELCYSHRLCSACSRSVLLINFYPSFGE